MSNPEEKILWIFLFGLYGLSFFEHSNRNNLMHDESVFGIKIRWISFMNGIQKVFIQQRLVLTQCCRKVICPQALFRLNKFLETKGANSSLNYPNFLDIL